MLYQTASSDSTRCRSTRIAQNISNSLAFSYKQARSLDDEFAVMIVNRRCDYLFPLESSSFGCTLQTYIKYRDNMYQASINMGSDGASVADTTVVCRVYHIGRFDRVVVAEKMLTICILPLPLRKLVTECTVIRILARHLWPSLSDIRIAFRTQHIHASRESKEHKGARWPQLVTNRELHH
jgi:hypothetical protein